MMEGGLIKNQRVDEGRMEAEHGKLDYKDSSEHEEVKLFSHSKGADEPDPPGADIRDVPEASGTQRDEWLLRTEPLQGARPKWIKGGDPQWYPSRQGAWTMKPLGGSRPEHGTSWRSDPSDATGSAKHARCGRGNSTEEGCSRTWGLSGS